MFDDEMVVYQCIRGLVKFEHNSALFNMTEKNFVVGFKNNILSGSFYFVNNVQENTFKR